MDARQERGMVIAATKKIQQRDGAWIVPSQSSNARYTVIHRTERQTCTCPDHELGHVCKHIHAVTLVIQRELFDDGQGTVTEKKSVTVTETKTTYRQNWPAYNAAQRNEKEKFQSLLRDLCQGVEEKPQEGRGRRRVPMCDAIFSAAFKVYSTLSGRRFMSDLADAHNKGYIGRLPCYNTIFNILESEETTPILKALIEQSAMPLRAIEVDFAADSSGFTSSRFHRWYDHKYGVERQQHDWVKAHIMCGVKTNVVTAVEIHGRDASDTKQLPALLEATAKNFTMREVSADKGYGSLSNYACIEAHGATPFIAFKSIHNGNGKNNANKPGRELWAKMYHFFQFRREDFARHYHKRSNVESTFSMMKAKFGDGVRSKTDVAMKNEVLCKMLCHNLCCLIQAAYELGVEPTFWDESTLQA
jgi:transposase